MAAHQLVETGCLSLSCTLECLSDLWSESLTGDPECFLAEVTFLDVFPPDPVYLLGAPSPRGCQANPLAS